MELYDVMRTTFSSREFTADSVPDALLAKILDNARFAPSGGNRQGWRVVVVKDPATRTALRDLYLMNMTHATLFPDLDGLARSLAYELENHWAFDPRTMKPRPEFEDK